MNASVNVERNSWRLPPDETVQVADPRSKSEVKYINDIIIFLNFLHSIIFICVLIKFMLFNPYYMKIILVFYFIHLKDLYGDSGHNWRSIIFSLLVIGFVIAGIVTAIYLLG